MGDFGDDFEGAFSFVMLFCLLFFLSLACATRSDDVEGTVITTQGVAAIERKPNLVMVTTSFVSKGGSPGAARKAHSKSLLPIRAHILSFIAQHNTVDDKIGHESLRVTPQYRYDNGRSTVTGYEASTTFLVQLDEIDAVGALVDDLTSSGATIDSIDFSLKEKEKTEAYEEARTAAVTAAHDNAKIMASAVDMRVVKIISIKDETAPT